MEICGKISTSQKDSKTFTTKLFVNKKKLVMKKVQ